MRLYNLVTLTSLVKLLIKLISDIMIIKKLSNLDRVESNFNPPKYVLKFKFRKKGILKSYSNYPYLLIIEKFLN